MITCVVIQILQTAKGQDAKADHWAAKSGVHRVVHPETHPLCKRRAQQALSGTVDSYFNHNANMVNTFISQSKPHEGEINWKDRRASRAEMFSILRVSDLSEDLTCEQSPQRGFHTRVLCTVSGGS